MLQLLAGDIKIQLFSNIVDRKKVYKERRSCRFLIRLARNGHGFDGIDNYRWHGFRAKNSAAADAELSLRIK